jgi:UDP-N-acetylmuramoyl-L-alanyl-D-glutamate--2,6-diaminopimelate ligase
MPRLSDLVQQNLASDPEIAGVTADSRKVAPGFLFAAFPGSKADGRSFIPAALAAGAAAVLAPEDVQGLPVPVVHPHDLRRAYALAAKAFWGRQPKISVAVTGTNGKTSVAAFCRQVFEHLGHKAASMGTLGVRAGAEQITPAGLTTPDACWRRSSTSKARRGGCSGSAAAQAAAKPTSTTPTRRTACRPCWRRCGPTREGG